MSAPGADLTAPVPPVDSLNAPRTPGRFSLPATFASRSRMFGQDRRTIVVVGAQWGDEGKGKLVDVLAERAQWVVRYQGGANAGHTVDIGDLHFVLHQIPSGILDRKSTRLNSSHVSESRMPSS